MRKILIIFIFLTGYLVSAQNKITEARSEIALYNYSKAVILLQGETDRGSEKSQRTARLLLAGCYRMLNDAANARQWYEKALLPVDFPKGFQVAPADWFHYAQALRSCGEYGLSKKIFLHYDSLNPGDPAGKLFAGFCDSALLWQSAKPACRVAHVKQLNSPQSEFGAVFYHNGIIFASDRTREEGKGKTYGWTGNSYLKLFVSAPVVKDSLCGPYTPPVAAPGLPVQEWHDGPVCFNHDFTVMFINRTLASHDKGKKEDGPIRTHLLKIFISTFTGGNWSTPQPFFLNSDSCSVGHPALSPDGNTLYFVSDMKGGFGETDLYSCTREGNGWGKPVNLGPAVNTAGKEMFPYAAENGDLYFSSDGLPGFGGLDLFVTRKVDGKWLTPKNLGSPVNSPADDFSLVTGGDGNTGLFSSNRPGGAGGDDIYSFASIPVETPKPPVPPAITAVPKPPAPPAISIDTLQVNKPYRIENIFYDFDKWNIREDARKPLNQLVALMKRYPITIELGSHTDCRGSEEYNRVLSQKRAESAVQYIISQGIDPSRIRAKGYGKSQLANRCNCTTGVECSEAGHQYNRRTEFRILSK